MRSNSSGGTPSRVRKPCVCPAGALRGRPESITKTERRPRTRVSAAPSPATPPPTITTSNSFVMLGMVRTWRAIQQAFLPEWQTERMPDDLHGVLNAVGPRLRALRRERNVTLEQLAGSTGISVSTLSRLESGQRRPTLELLLPLAQAHRVPLDELVGAPATGDPRIHPRPIKRH